MLWSSSPCVSLQEPPHFVFTIQHGLKYLHLSQSKCNFRNFLRCLRTSSTSASAQPCASRSGSRSQQSVCSAHSWTLPKISTNTLPKGKECHEGTSVKNPAEESNSVLESCACAPHRTAGAPYRHRTAPPAHRTATVSPLHRRRVVQTVLLVSLALFAPRSG